MDLFRKSSRQPTVARYPRAVSDDGDRPAWAQRLRNERLRARGDWPGYAPHRARWAAQEEALFAVERPWEYADAIIDNGTSPNCRWPGAG